jgi:WXG100 family type VII secretion target
VQFTVTAAELISAATTCTNTNRQIQAQIQQMRSLVAGLMGSYQGPAATQLQTLSDRWGKDADALNYVLTTIADGLTANASNYVSSESNNNKNYTTVLASLPNAKF